MTLPEGLLVLLAVAGYSAALFLLRRNFVPQERSLLWVSLAAHQLAAIAMILIVQDYYEGGDMLMYQYFGMMHAARMREDFFGVTPAVLELVFQLTDHSPLPGAMAGTNTGSMAGIAALLMFFLNDSLYAACAVIAGATFFAKLAIYDVVRKELPDASKPALLVACLLVPSAVFWSSGMLKEPVAVIGLGMLCRGSYLLATTERRLRGAIWLAIGGLSVGLTKAYLIPPFGLAVATWFIVRAGKGRVGLATRTGHLVLAAVAAGGIIWMTGSVLPEFAPENFAEEALRAQEVGQRVRGQSHYTLGAPASDTLAGQLALAPQAMINTLFRPVVFEATNPFVFLNSLEMLWLTVALMIALFRRGIVGTLREVMGHPALAAFAVFVLVLSIGVGLTTTNLGALSRYRMPLIPFYAMLVMVLAGSKYRTPVPERRNAPLAPGRVRAP
jgi:hypothetical protein